MRSNTTQTDHATFPLKTKGGERAGISNLRLRFSYAGVAFGFLFSLASPPSFAALDETAHSPTSQSPSNSQESLPDLRVPRFKKVRPHWALEVTSSLNAFGQHALLAAQGTNPIYAFSFQGEYQPAFLQDYGVLGIGPSFNVYPAFGSGITNGFLMLFGAGAQIRYQARYFREQPVVPVFAYSLEYFSYQFNTGPNGGTRGGLISSGPTVGLWILLNFLESSSAANFYVENGVSRTYLALEYRSLSGKDSNISYSGGSYYFGLRFEF